MSDILTELRSRPNNGLPPVPRGPTYRGLMGNPPEHEVLRVVDRKLLIETPIAWEIWSEGEPLPIMLGTGRLKAGEFAVWKKDPSARLAGANGLVWYQGKTYGGVNEWFYDYCGEHVEGFTPRWAERESV